MPGLTTAWRTHRSLFRVGARQHGEDSFWSSLPRSCLLCLGSGAEGGWPCADAALLTRCHAPVQGIDLEAGGRNKKVCRTAPKSDNVYLALLVKVRWSHARGGRGAPQR